MIKKVRRIKKITLADLAAYLHLATSTVSLALRGDPKIKAATRVRVAAAAAYKGYSTKKARLPEPKREKQQKNQVTMQDVAERLGTSAATVCRAFNRSPGVSQKLIARVLAAAEEMSYTLNHNASNLVARNGLKGEFPQATIYTIAKTLRISPSTVSRAFSPTAAIAHATRRRVLKEAARVNFTPNADATALKTGHSINFALEENMAAPVRPSVPELHNQNPDRKTIAILVPQLAHPLIMDLLSGIEQVAVQHQAQIIVMKWAPGTLTLENRSLNTLVALVDGLIYLPFSTPAIASYPLAKDKPGVVLGSFIAGGEQRYVRTDQFEAIYQATAFLLKAGCRHIVLVDSVLADEAHARRRAGFLKAHFEHNQMPFAGQIVRFPRLRRLPVGLPEYLSDTNPASDGLILIDRLPENSEVNQLRQLGIRPENIFAIELESGSGNFQSPAAVNRLLLMKTFRKDDSGALSSIDLPARFLAPAKPGDRLRAELSMLPAALSQVNPPLTSR